MQPRRSKVVPDPLVYPDKANNASNGGPTEVGAVTAGNGVPRPRLCRVPSPPSIQPSTTPMSTAEPFSPGLNVYRSGGGAGITASISPKTTVLVDHHVTNTGAVVRLEQVDYSKAMRAYRVCRQEGGVTPYDARRSSSRSSNSISAGGAAASARSGSPISSAPGSAATTSCTSSNGPSAASPTTGGTLSTVGLNGNNANGINHSRSASGLNAGGAPNQCPVSWRVVLLRLFGAADMVLVATAVACFLVLVSRLHASQQMRGRGNHIISGNGGGGAGGRGGVSTSWVMSLLASLIGRYVGARVGATGFDAAKGESPSLISEDKASTRAVATHNSGSALVPTPTVAASSSSSYTQATHAAALDVTVTIVLFFFSVVLLAKRLSSAFSRVYVEEVLVMRGVGLQFASYGIFHTLRYKVFVDLQMLRSLVIHDAFARYQPIFYLSSSVENRAERVVFFPDTLPRLAVLRPVLNGIRGVLYGEPEEGPSLAELEECWNTSSREISDDEPFTEDSFA
ncbi:hypothetical protein ABB37_09069 [Leptomonas pyrrhocoris]|uniref:Phosphatidylinositol N-acetylglucosaminyltransferase subunit H conserved domain-containing protein n=1 Tax=Leptomonas pyrrhocoris TaxID=157538 RepID=A0A0M9FS71_LEPPY|nr:hypothetical protein ABB37_09069 [Leptomonas pyrrhocoris]KPA74786.1 hypothetical protein ABB37_09069 [Leptomonas pyrrhocoris]|eukprot:XP_015653225.1 hypothetical protein ABB37_09069 [Leptomonas pyrrhocoris]